VEIIPQTVAALGVLVGLPWLILHYITQWKKSPTLTVEDERLLDDLNDLARRLDERVCTVERIMTAENPNWRSLGCDPAATAIEDRTRDNIENIRRER
jgi:phage shock protein B